MSKTNGVRSYKKTAKIASRVLKDKRSSSTSKKLAGGVLGNRRKKS